MSETRERSRSTTIQYLRTEDRDQVMRELYPTYMHTQQLVERLNMLPGFRVQLHDLQRWAVALNVRRPHRQKEIRAVMLAIRTAERDQMMRELYPTMATAGDITDRLNELPGKHIRRQQVPDYACALCLTRTGEYRRAMSLRGRRGPTAIPPIPGMVAAEEVDLHTILEWGRHNGAGQILDSINDARRLWGLPAFIIRRRAA